MVFLGIEYLLNRRHLLKFVICEFKLPHAMKPFVLSQFMFSVTSLCLFVQKVVYKFMPRRKFKVTLFLC